MNYSTLTGRPAYDGGCYHCKYGAKPCICPGKSVAGAAWVSEMPGQAGRQATFDTERKQIMDHLNLPVADKLMTQDASLDAAQGKGDDRLFPRRRDVREMCEEMLHALLAHYVDDPDKEYGEGFDRGFLTRVRNLMHVGVPFQDAVGAFAPILDEDPEAMDKDLSDLFFPLPE